jgi:hypothetical protein
VHDRRGPRQGGRPRIHRLGGHVGRGDAGHGGPKDHPRSVGQVRRAVRFIRFPDRPPHGHTLRQGSGLQVLRQTVPIVSPNRYQSVRGFGDHAAEDEGPPDVRRGDRKAPGQEQGGRALHQRGGRIPLRDPCQLRITGRDRVHPRQAHGREDGQHRPRPQMLLHGDGGRRLRGDRGQGMQHHHSLRIRDHPREGRDRDR